MWLHFVIPAEITIYEAKGRTYLGDQDAAIELYQQSLENPGLSRRNRACDQARFAAALSSGGETAGAVAEGLAVLPALEETVALAQRLSIACALVHDPELLFLDEPTGALDPHARRNLWDLLRKISAEGRTVVLTTHHMDGASLQAPVPCRCGRAEVAAFLTGVKNGEFDDLCPGVSCTVVS